jgi:16S rRNA (cytosine967-C5)-methyltransferase
VNLRRVDRETARARLSSELGREVTPTSWSPLGLRLAGRTNLGGTSPSKDGWIEVEDEGSQIMVLSTDCKVGLTVLDACAGAGGKTLAFADLLFREVTESPRRESELVACDVDSARLRELSRRGRGANVTDLVQVVTLEREGPLPQDLPSADLVLVDAPCSGTGTLRRNPDLKLRYGAGDIKDFARNQRMILERFAPCVKPGGKLAYVTCSLLREENEEVALAFSDAHPEFKESASEWATAHLPPACLHGSWVTIDPVKTGTDGFFMARWRKGIVNRE